MKTLKVALFLLAPAMVAAQVNESTKADYWVRASLARYAATSQEVEAVGLAASANMAFGSMVNEIRQVHIGESQRESAILVGLRSVESNRSLSVAAGLGIASHENYAYTYGYRSRTATGRTAPYPGLALELHGTGFIKSWFGVGGGIVANVNSKRSFWAMMLSIDVGTMRDPRKSRG